MAVNAANITQATLRRQAPRSRVPMIKNTYREGQKTHYSALAIVNLSAISSKFEQNFTPIRFRLASCLQSYSNVKDWLDTYERFPR
jgi:hypothetical protein